MWIQVKQSVTTAARRVEDELEKMTISDFKEGLHDEMCYREGQINLYIFLMAYCDLTSETEDKIKKHITFIRKVIFYLRQCSESEERFQQFCNGYDDDDDDDEDECDHESFDTVSELEVDYMKFQFPRYFKNLFDSEDSEDEEQVNEDYVEEDADDEDDEEHVEDQDEADDEDDEEEYEIRRSAGGG